MSSVLFAVLASPLRPNDAVETDRVVCGVGVVEIKAAGVKVRDAKAAPGAGEQVGAGFHGNRNVRGAGYGAGDCTVAEARSGEGRVPEHGWAAGIGGAPAGGAGQVVHGCVVAILEHIRAGSRGVAGEVESFQAAAVAERVVADGGHAVGDRHAGQAGAGGERPVADGGDGVSAQFVCDGKRPGICRVEVSNCGLAVGDGVGVVAVRGGTGRQRDGQKDDACEHDDLHYPAPSGVA